MMRRILVVSTLLLLTPATAHAATLANSGGTLTYTAAAGKANQVQFAQAGADVVVSRNPADADPIDASSCTVNTPGTMFTCSGVTAIVADGKDGADALTAPALTTVRATLKGGEGDDTLTGGGAADALDGGDGDDTLTGGAGADSIAGAAGLDTAELSGTPLTVTLDDVADDGTPGEGDNVHGDVEDVDADTGPGGVATLTGSDAGNVLTVLRGGGTLAGGAGSDTLQGGPEADTINARDGYADRVVCGAGIDAVTADQLDQVASSCENVTREPVIGGADDRPPLVTWTAPDSGASLSADATSTLAVSATDDRGIAKVQFFDDDRLVCEDAAAPYTCAYAPRGADVGRDTLVARAVDTGDQSTSAIQAVTVDRFGARSLSLTLSPSRDRKAPYRFFASGKLTLPAPVSRTQGCGDGQVTITIKAGKKTVGTRRIPISRVCEYKLRISFPHRPASTSTLRFTARFSGNDVLQAASSPSRLGRTR
jgi:Ca2+-binding RTX toxin-like protein